jgi:hypothetical protein
LRICGIEGDGFLEALQRSRNPWTPPVQHGAALQILLIGVHVVRRDLDQPRRGTGVKRHLEPLDNRVRDFILHVEDVCDLAIVAF